MSNQRIPNKRGGTTQAHGMPLGYGFAPDVAPEPLADGVHLHDSDAGRTAGIADDDLFRQNAYDDFIEQIEMFEASSTPTHLWRAWRIARCAGDLPQAMLDRLIPHLDTMAKHGAGGSPRVAQRERRDSIVRLYETLLESKKNPRKQWERGLTKESIMVRIGEQFAMSRNAVEQVLIKEGVLAKIAGYPSK